MADMLRRQILPAVSAVTAELCERGWKKEQMGVSHKADDAVAREMGQLTDKLYAATEKWSETSVRSRQTLRRPWLTATIT